MFALPVTDNTPLVIKFPPVIFPVAVTIAVPILPTLALPVALTMPPVIKFPPRILPVAVINPAVPILPIFALPATDRTPPVTRLAPLILPLLLNVPAIFAPVPVTTITFETPVLLIAIFESVYTLTLLFPLEIEDPAAMLIFDS